MESQGKAPDAGTSFHLVASDDEFACGPTITCNKCGDEKPVSEFHKDRNMPGGYKKVCKSCKAEYDRQKKPPKVSNDMVMVALERAAYKIIKEML